MLFGGIMEPPNPVPMRNTIKTMKFGAKAAPMIQTPIKNKPVKATGRRPKESENGPINGAKTAQEKKVAAANWPATATEVSNSSAMSTSKGPSIKATVLFKNKAAAIMANDLTWLVAGWVVVSVVIGNGRKLSDHNTTRTTKTEIKGKRSLAGNGGAAGTRTPYLFNAIEALSQMSYSPTCTRWPCGPAYRKL